MKLDYILYFIRLNPSFPLIPVCSKIDSIFHTMSSAGPFFTFLFYCQISIMSELEIDETNARFIFFWLEYNLKLITQAYIADFHVISSLSILEHYLVTAFHHLV